MNWLRHNWQPMGIAIYALMSVAAMAWSVAQTYDSRNLRQLTQALNAAHERMYAAEARAQEADAQVRETKAVLDRLNGMGLHFELAPPNE